LEKFTGIWEYYQVVKTQYVGQYAANGIYESTSVYVGYTMVAFFAAIEPEVAIYSKSPTIRFYSHREDNIFINI